MVGGHHVAMRKGSRVDRSLDSHGVHVRCPRVVVGKVLRRHGHLVRHRGRSHSLGGGGGTGSGSGAVVKKILTAKGRCPRVEVVYWRLHRHGSRAVLFRGEGSVAHVVKGLSRRGGEIVGVARGGVVGAVVADRLAKVEGVQREDVLVLHWAAGHGHGFNCSRHRAGCQSFFGFILVGFKFLRLADRVTIPVGLGVGLSALYENSGVSVWISVRIFSLISVC